ncbi:hypothetical protein BGY98DRAFT_909596 [Russula aff. rugulosa BPL654]|nr:hypothetical protein BGY98DRAFT_909596 [Russula aff. rugulosa BPL654]
MGYVAFEINTVKLLMSLFDLDKNGSIDVNEVTILELFLLYSWQGVFGYFDKNKNNTIDGDELEQALKQYGYDLSTDLQELLKRKYGAAAAPLAGDSEPGITFDRFMRACVVVKQLKELYDALDKDSENRVKINYETF